jgi:hypothetical protein
MADPVVVSWLGWWLVNSGTGHTKRNRDLGADSRCSRTGGGMARVPDAAGPCRMRFAGCGILSAPVPQLTSIFASHPELPLHGPNELVQTLRWAPCATTTPSVAGAVPSRPRSR